MAGLAPFAVGTDRSIAKSAMAVRDGILSGYWILLAGRTVIRLAE
jgi:hypothetical protein